MIITAIDPGTTESAFVVFAHDAILAKGDAVKNGDLIEMLADFRSQVVVCEMVACYGMPVGKETFETVRWIGRFEQAAKHLGLRYEDIYRAEVKMNLCKSMKANDATIRQALIDRFGKVGTKKNQGKLYGVSKHIWSALAIAVTYHDKNKFFIADGKTCWFSTEPCETCFLPMATDGKNFWCSRGQCENEGVQSCSK